MLDTIKVGDLVRLVTHNHNLAVVLSINLGFAEVITLHLDTPILIHKSDLCHA
jgi:hypothetical protein